MVSAFSLGCRATSTGPEEHCAARTSTSTSTASRQPRRRAPAQIRQGLRLRFLLAPSSPVTAAHTQGRRGGDIGPWNCFLKFRPFAGTSHSISSATKEHGHGNWVVALKALLVIHRALRDGNSGAFAEELLGHGRRRGHALQMSSFKDDSSHLTWDCSAGVRTYALFLEQRLECLAVLRYDVEAERLRPPPPPAASERAPPKGQSRTRNLGKDDLLEQLPALQRLLFRLVGCQPEGAAFGNYLIQYALALVMKESFKIYCAVNDGITNLVDLAMEKEVTKQVTTTFS